METILFILAAIATVALCVSVCFSMIMFFTVPTIFALVLAYGFGGPVIGSIIAVPLLLAWWHTVRLLYDDYKFERMYEKANNPQTSPHKS